MTRHQTAEQVTEILARELYVRQASAHSDQPKRAEPLGRDEWYRTLTPDKQEYWRRQAWLLQNALAESNLALTWVVQ
jgi:hypothetical protein